MSLSCIRLFLLAAGAVAVGCLSPVARADGEKVGIASAVNPDAVGTPPSGNKQTLVIGTEVLFKERIVTAAEGQAQLLFLDHSSLTVAPQSELVIDEFVYDPNSGTGKIAVSALKGVMRYVGGRISKTSEVTFTTPTAVVGIRGGIALISVAADGQTQAVFLFGQHMTVSAGGLTQTVIRPGYQVTVAQTTKVPSAPIPAPPRMIDTAFKSMEAKPPTSGGTTGAVTQKTSGPAMVAVSANTASARPSEAAAKSDSSTSSGTGGSTTAASTTSQSTTKQSPATTAAKVTSPSSGSFDVTATASALVASPSTTSKLSVADASITTSHIATILASNPQANLVPAKPTTRIAPAGAAQTTAAASTTISTSVSKATQTRAAGSVEKSATTIVSKSTKATPASKAPTSAHPPSTAKPPQSSPQLPSSSKHS